MSNLRLEKHAGPGLSAEEPREQQRQSPSMGDGAGNSGVLSAVAKEPRVPPQAAEISWTPQLLPKEPVTVRGAFCPRNVDSCF